MKRYWFRVSINEEPRKIVKVLIQAPDLEEAKVILKNTIELYYPGYTELDILNDNVELEENTCYAVIGDGKTTHYTTARFN